MTDELSTERAIEALYTVRAYYESLTAGYPKGKDCRGIGDVMCSEIANSCLMAIKALEQQPKRGKWIEQNDTSKHHYGWYYCSECGAYIMSKCNYCSECGAEMEVEK